PPSLVLPPLPDSDLGSKTFVVPVKNFRSLSLIFPLPDLMAHYKSSPSNYIAHLIGHEGKGSLLSELKMRGWSDNLEAGEKFEVRGFAIFSVNINLTEEGITHVDEIIGLVFQYIELIRQEGLKETIFKQCSDINDMHFKYLDKSKPYDYVSTLSSRLQRYPMEEALAGPTSLTNGVKSSLLKMQVFVVAKMFEEKATQSERWYGTKYVREAIDPSLLKGWSEKAFKELCPRLEIPDSGSFIPKDFGLEFPSIIMESPLMRLWFKQDNVFLLPKAKLKLEIKSPLVNLDPHHVNLSNMFILLIRDDLNEYVYSARLTGLNYSLQFSKKGMLLSVHGFNDKVFVLFDKIIHRMTTFKANPTRFHILKEQYERSLRNFKMDQPHEHSIYYNNIILSDRDWQKTDLLDIMEDCTPESLQAFIEAVFSNVYIEGLAHGNLTESQALELFRVMNKALSSSKALSPSQMSRLASRELVLEEDSHSVFEATNEYHKCSSIESYYQIGLRNPRSNILLELLAQVLDEPCYNVLRTKEQLGYLVHSGIRRSPAVQGLRFVIRSDRHPRYLDTRIEAFLQEMVDFLRNMTAEVFNDHKEALRVKRLEKPKRLSAMTDRYWTEILRQSYTFDRDTIETKELSTISLEELRDFFQRHCLPESKSRRKLACHILSMTPDGAGKKEEDEEKVVELSPEPTFIKDIYSFKSARSLFPQSNQTNDHKSFLRNQNASS
ncbi:Metalloproteaselike, partial [Caligus rogercresseyi]